VDYSFEVLRRFGAPGRAERPRGPDFVVAGTGEDRTLNIWVRFQLALADACVVTAQFEVFGCPHTVAAASWVAEWLEGRTLEAVRQLDIRQVAAELEVPAEKLGKLLRIEDAVRTCAEQALDASMKGTL
jgi:NifU-like protein involved in Fe-S cluster formation